MADDGTANDDASWTVELDSVQRLVSDDPADDDTLFAVEFKAVGLGINADFEVMVSDIADEGQVVVAALDALQDGLEMWARVLGRRRGAESIDPKPT